MCYPEGDWQVLRRDDTAEVEARYTLETDDRAPLYIDHLGYRHGPLDRDVQTGRGRAS